MADMLFPLKIINGSFLWIRIPSACELSLQWRSNISSCDRSLNVVVLRRLKSSWSLALVYQTWVHRIGFKLYDRCVFTKQSIGLTIIMIIAIPMTTDIAAIARQRTVIMAMVFNTIPPLHLLPYHNRHHNHKKHTCQKHRHHRAYPRHSIS